MPKPRSKTGENNLISLCLKILRELHGLSQRDLASALQLSGIDLDYTVRKRPFKSFRFKWLLVSINSGIK